MTLIMKTPFSQVHSVFHNNRHSQTNDCCNMESSGGHALIVYRTCYIVIKMFHLFNPILSHTSTEKRRQSLIEERVQITVHVFFLLIFFNTFCMIN